MLFDDVLEVAAFEVRVMRQGSDIAAIAFFWNEDGLMEVVTGSAPGAPVEALKELLVCATQALDHANWKPVSLDSEGATAQSDDPPF